MISEYSQTAAMCIEDVYSEHEQLWHACFALRGLSGMEQEILRLRFEEGWTFKMVGEKYNLSRERMRQLQEQALGKLRRTWGSWDSSPRAAAALAEARARAHQKAARLSSIAAEIAELKRENAELRIAEARNAYWGSRGALPADPWQQTIAGLYKVWARAAGVRFFDRHGLVEALR